MLVQYKKIAINLIYTYCTSITSPVIFKAHWPQCPKLIASCSIQFIRARRSNAQTTRTKISWLQAHMMPHVRNSVANLGILSQDLGIFLGHWDFFGIYILRITPWDFSWDFSKFRKIILNVNFLILINLLVFKSYPVKYFHYA